MTVHLDAAHSAAAGATRPEARNQGNTLSGAARQFESLLLNQWLQDVESSFGSAPGDEDDSTSGDDQMKSLGTQQLAGFLADSGGIGLGRLMQRALDKAAPGALTPASATHTAPAGSSDALRSVTELRARALVLSYRPQEPTP